MVLMVIQMGDAKRVIINGGSDDDARVGDKRVMKKSLAPVNTR